MLSAPADPLSWADLTRIYAHSPRLLAGGAVWHRVSLLDTVRLLRQTWGLPMVEARRLAAQEHARAQDSPHAVEMRTLTRELQVHLGAQESASATLVTSDLPGLWRWGGGAHVLAQLGHFPGVDLTATPVFRAFFQPVFSEHLALSIESHPQPCLRSVGTQAFSLLESGALARGDLSAVVFDAWTELAVWTEHHPIQAETFPELERAATRLFEPPVPRPEGAVLDGTLSQAELYAGGRIRAVATHSPTLTHHPGQVMFFEAVLRIAAVTLSDPRSLALVHGSQHELLWDG